jgi:hypothetical protein
LDDYEQWWNTKKTQQIFADISDSQSTQHNKMKNYSSEIGQIRMSSHSISKFWLPANNILLRVCVIEDNQANQVIT